MQGEELSQLYSRPQTYTGPLKVSQGQQDRSLILKKITDQNSWEDEGLTDKTHSQRWILHAVVVVLILTAVFIPLIINGLPSILPALYPEAVVQSFNTVNTLSAEKPVLVAADFDGSLYGELNWTLQPLFSHLMQKNIPMAFLSTNSVGATLMEKSLKELSAKNTAFDYDAEVVDLGYLAGGSIGLQSLARDPLTTMPLTSNLQPAWQSYPLSSIKQLSDFGALIVITENADTARYWIEQVKPSLGNTPLLVIISAQSAPLLQPYYDSGQITGYLAGVNSAAVYEALDQNSQNSGQLFSSYQITMLLVIVLILVGGIVSLIVGPRARETGERS